MMPSKYRPDVDGLRAVAVTLVLLFHGNLGCAGGYIGVDIFFVISGFLITGLILKEQQDQKFSLANFWVRRIRRIIPASMAMVIVVLAAGIPLMLPSDYEELGGSAIAQQLMLSNVYFWRNTGYFDGPAELKPLLHTWSLAVEEQFYLGYPFLLLFLNRFRRISAPLVIGLLLLFSLLVSQYFVIKHPIAGFFLLPTRAWELLLGGIICYLPPGDRLPRWSVSLGSWFSLAVIVITSVVYTSATQFPGVAAVLPCGATALLIYINSSGHTSLPAILLSSKPMVQLGLISYSLYLWHWPILAFLRYWLGSELPVWAACAALSCSVGIAILSWRYIEQPFRISNRERKASLRPLALYFGSSSLCIALAMIIYSTNGARFRFENDILVFDQKLSGAVLGEFDGDASKARLGKLPRLGSESSANLPGTADFVLWGDSHARMLASVFDTLARERNLRGIVAVKSATGPFLDFGSEEQVQWNREVLNLIVAQRIKVVIIAGRWEEHFNSTFATQKIASMSKAIRELHQHGVTVYLVEQVPLQKWNPNPRLARATLFKQPLPTGVTLAEYDAMLLPSKQFFNELEASGVKLIALGDDCFDGKGSSLLGDKGGCYYWDEDHLSPYGVEKLLAPRFSILLDEIKLNK